MIYLGGPLYLMTDAEADAFLVGHEPIMAMVMESQYSVRPSVNKAVVKAEYLIYFTEHDVYSSAISPLRGFTVVEDKMHYVNQILGKSSYMQDSRTEGGTSP